MNSGSCSRQQGPGSLPESSGERISAVRVCPPTGAGGAGSRAGRAPGTLCPPAHGAGWSDWCPGLRTGRVSGCGERAREGKRRNGKKRERNPQNGYQLWPAPQDLTLGCPTPETPSATTLQPRQASSFSWPLASEHYGGWGELGTPGDRRAVWPACTGQAEWHKLRAGAGWGARGADSRAPSSLSPGTDRLLPSLSGLAGLLSPPTSFLEGLPRDSPGFPAEDVEGPTWPRAASPEAPC